MTTDPTGRKTRPRRRAKYAEMKHEKSKGQFEIGIRDKAKEWGAKADVGDERKTQIGEPPLDDAKLTLIDAATTRKKEKQWPGRERRRRHRAKVSMRVMIRGGVGSVEPFEDIGDTIDASRDGLLIETTRGGYWEGQTIEVVFPYHENTPAGQPPHKSRVVRCNRMDSGLHYALGIEFQKVAEAGGERKSYSSIVTTSVRVLVVEPDAGLATGIGELLRADGYQVVCVASAKEALEILRDEIPDVLLADTETGDISGLDLCAIVKKHARLQHIPVIMLTKSANPSDYASCHKVGAVMCMAKPYTPGRLQHAVHLLAPPPAMRTAYSGKFGVDRIMRTP